MFHPLRNHNQLTRPDLEFALSALLANLHPKHALHHQEQFVFVLVMMPDEITFHFAELDVRIVKVTSDLRSEVLRKCAKLLSQIDHLHAHTTIVFGGSTGLVLGGGVGLQAHEIACPTNGSFSRGRSTGSHSAFESRKSAFKKRRLAEARRQCTQPDFNERLPFRTLHRAFLWCPSLAPSSCANPAW